MIQRKHPLAKCEDCPLQGEPYVPSAGPQGADLVIVGEAPGKDEARGGVPFSGPSGKLLDTVLKHHGIDRAGVLVTNTVLCRPPENRTPSKKEINCCSERLQDEIRSCGPDHILALGNTAASTIMGYKTKITQFRAGPPKESVLYPGVKVVPSVHPAACLRSADSFPSLVADVRKVVNGAGSQVRSKWEPPRYRSFNEADQARQALQELCESRYENIVVDIETAHDKDAGYEHPNHYRLLCVGICYDAGRAIVIGEAALQDSGVRNLFSRFLTSRNITCHNGKFDLQGLHSIAPEAKLHFDTMLASYATDERKGIHSLEHCSVEKLGSPSWKDALKVYKSYADAPWEELHRYNAYDVANTFDLKPYYEGVLGSDGKKLLEFLVRVSNAYVPIELEGIGVDIPLLERMKTTYLARMDQIEAALKPSVGNPRSVPQVEAALRNLGIPFVKTTDAAFLQSVVDRPFKPEALGEFCQLLLDYRKEQKLYGTYIKGADKRLFEGRLYPTVLLHGTTTGRPACRNPNLYNIPRGSSIRSLYVAAPGNVFVQCDYSQVEARVVTCEAQEPYFADIFRNPERDIHQEVASRLGITRQRAKMVVYGLAYEMSANGLAFRLGIPLEEAARYVNEFHHVIPEIVKWKERVKRTVLTEKNDLVTPFGRHRRFWLITNENREDIIKEAIAFYPQSIASDICLGAVAQLVEDGLKVRLSVYDSIMVECAKGDAPDVAIHMEKVMTESGLAYSDYVPFAVDTKIGKSWGEFG